MLNKPCSYIVSRLRGTSQEYLSSYHLGMSDHVSDSTWSGEEYCAIQFETKSEAEAVSDRFPGTFVQEFMDYEGDE